jgi:hypothetical protein
MSNLSRRTVFAEIRSLVDDERRITRELIERIAFVDQHRLYAEIGFPSLFAWLVEGLKYSKASAYRRIQAARFVKAVPEAREMIESGAVNVTTLSNLQCAIRNEEKTMGAIPRERKMELLAMVDEKSSEQAERIVAEEFGIQPVAQGEVRAVCGGRTSVTLVFSAEQIALLERLKEVSAHSHFNASLEEVLELAMKDALKKRDPLLKQSRSRENSDSPFGFAAEPIVQTGNRQPLKSSLRNQVLRRDGGKCTYRDPVTKRVCASRHQVEIDHIMPVAYGGKDELQNLRCLCRAHNRLSAEKVGLDMRLKEGITD